MGLTAMDVKKLREATGVGMMQCKKALTETNGDFQAAVEFLRKKGLDAAQKKQSRIAAEGLVVTLVKNNRGVVAEINCETDFVSKGNDFKSFAEGVARHIWETTPADVAALRSEKASEINEFTLKCGEKVDIRRFEIVETDGSLGHYNHGGKIGILVEASAGTREQLKDVAMHIAAMSPQFISQEEVGEDFKNKESEIYTAQLKEQGKPDNIIQNIVRGKLAKLFKEICLLEQAFLKDSDRTVKQFLGDVRMRRFVKFHLGEGIEKKEDNLAEEVAKMTGVQ